jgi:hypothetical protein
MKNLKDLKQALPPSRMGGNAAVARPLGTAFRGNDTAQRPTTSVTSAYYTSGSKLKEKADELMLKADSAGARTPEEMLKKFTREINDLLEQSALASTKGNHGQALELAKEAVNKDKNLHKVMESNNLPADGLDLSYSVQFNYALSLQKNGMLQEALAKYNEIIKSKLYAQAGRLHINIGNIYF